MMRQNFFPRLVFTHTSKGGFDQVMFLFLVVQGFFPVAFGLNLSFYVYPLLSGAAWYISAALLNASLSDRGWLFFVCT